MDTTNLNINTSQASGYKSEKLENAKKVASKASQFVGAAGLGVAGTMAANAMTSGEEESNEDLVVETNVSSEDTAQDDAISAPVTEFDPNEIIDIKYS